MKNARSEKTVGLIIKINILIVMKYIRTNEEIIAKKPLKTLMLEKIVKQIYSNVVMGSGFLY